MALAEIAESDGEDPPGITRILYSEVDVKARRLVKQMMQDSGLSVYEDAIGNVFGRWEGSDDSLRSQVFNYFRDGSAGIGFVLLLWTGRHVPLAYFQRWAVFRVFGGGGSFTVAGCGYWIAY